MAAPKIRMHVPDALHKGQTVHLTREQSHYLFGVMRLNPGDPVYIFNGRDGEWRAEVIETGRRGGMLSVRAASGPQQLPPDLWLLFAPIKKARTDFIVEKATEMGAARILPVTTEFTNSERINRERLQQHAVEAAEQCGGTYVPDVADLARLDRLLADWPSDRRLMFCDEALVGARTSLMSAPPAAKWAVLIGPEGGFSTPERDRLKSAPFVTPVSLGPRILRADTAAVAALTLWQSMLGDW